MPPVRGSRIWNVKVKLNKGEFVPVINRGTVNTNELTSAEIGDEVTIVGTFGIWMNPEQGQYGIKFDAKTIDY